MWCNFLSGQMLSGSTATDLNEGPLRWVLIHLMVAYKRFRRWFNSHGLHSRISWPPADQTEILSICVVPVAFGKPSQCYRATAWLSLLKKISSWLFDVFCCTCRKKKTPPTWRSEIINIVRFKKRINITSCRDSKQTNKNRTSKQMPLTHSMAVLDWCRYSNHSFLCHVWTPSLIMLVCVLWRTQELAKRKKRLMLLHFLNVGICHLSWLRVVWIPLPIEATLNSKICLSYHEHRYSTVQLWAEIAFANKAYFTTGSNNSCALGILKPLLKVELLLLWSIPSIAIMQFLYWIA